LDKSGSIPFKTRIGNFGTVSESPYHQMYESGCGFIVVVYGCYLLPYPRMTHLCDELRVITGNGSVLLSNIPYWVYFNCTPFQFKYIWYFFWSNDGMIYDFL